MNNRKIKGKSNVIRGLGRKSYNEEAIKKYYSNFVISFQFLDRTQGQDFQEWEKDGLLVKMLETIRDYCCKTMEENQGDNFKIYGEFPECSEFKKPKHVPEDSQWASLHIQGKECLAGTVYENVFYVVFLDKEHKFWPSKKKHT